MDDLPLFANADRPQVEPPQAKSPQAKRKRASKRRLGKDADPGLGRAVDGAPEPAAAEAGAPGAGPAAVPEPGPLVNSDLVAPAAPTTWSVLQLNQAIALALEAAFPGEVWVRGEIQGLDRSRAPGKKHWYFELVEKKAARDEVAARVPVALLEWNRVGMPRDEQDFMRQEAADGREVRIRAHIGYYAPFGKLQLEMTGVDPAFTLGQLAASRERILRTLAAERLLEKNKLVPLPLVPLRIGLVTSIGSAAYNDFVQELSRSGYGFRVLARDVRVQGEETEPSVVAALKDFARRRPDVVVIVRGGGSRSDLAWFDSEAIARAIAAMPVPVLTGIGHEIDRSVADEVAHQYFKTPTACAAFLAERAREFALQLRGSWEQVAGLARSLLDVQSEEIMRVAATAGRLARTTVRVQDRALAERARRVRREAPRLLEQHGMRLARRSGEIAAAGRLRVAHQAAGLAAARQALALPRLLRPLLARHRHGEELVARVLHLAGLRAATHLERMAAQELRVRALDPRRVLARGFTLTNDGGGRLLRSATDVVQGATLVTTFVDGQARSRVEQTPSRPPGTQGEPA